MKAKLFAATMVAFSAFAVTQARAQDVYVVPDEVDRYVTEQPYDDSVIYDDEVTVGEALPEDVIIREVPEYDDYSYAIVNKRRVIVEPRTRKVIKVYN
ncbi:DUF1236 domain-containing protein [Rhizobium sp. LjRoot254]|uniref:DUF1236 domain-containing protein n=1 Tax=Rhizobium sp. LjRoot254 TaxID=3342297 RepID=UPI003F4FE3DC